MVSSGYLFEYYQSWYNAAGHADNPKNGSGESSQMHKWLAQMSLRHETDQVHPTTNRLWSFRCIVGDVRSLWDALVKNPGAPHRPDVVHGTVYVWEDWGGIMFRWYVTVLLSNYHRQAWNQVERGPLAAYLLIGMIRFWRCPVYTSDVDPCTFLFAG